MNTELENLSESQKVLLAAFREELHQTKQEIVNRIEKKESWLLKLWIYCKKLISYANSEAQKIHLE